MKKRFVVSTVLFRGNDYVNRLFDCLAENKEEATGAAVLDAMKANPGYSTLMVSSIEIDGAAVHQQPGEH